MNKFTQEATKDNEKDYYLEVVKNKIRDLIILRREAHGNEEEQKRISIKLDKLYDIQFTILQQKYS